MTKEFGTSELKNMFWAAAETGNVHTFQQIMDQIKEFNKNAYNWLTNIDAKHWSMSCFDTSSKVEHLTNNHVESFNDWIDEVKQILRRARHAEVRRVGNNEFQVDYKGKRCSVILDQRWCICGQWQIRGIPCVHAAACINVTRANINDSCSEYFTTEMWRKTYEPMIHPIPDESIRGNGRGSEQGKGLSKDQATTFDAPPMTSSEPVNKKRGRGRPRGRGHGRIHYTTNQENYQPQESIEEHTLKNAEELNIHGAPSDLFQSQPTQ
ncbi:hypothetical protein G4B88_017115 [Cannabis sativa]|uniref:SWIM-type domain-containing protein n=1 Tax=Cannabis sativa TaxID=3483 RepID=A0A7J6HV60_CANSA|nr:hypothetical protein G4B88_017115 [Cannabis sativa]